MVFKKKDSLNESSFSRTVEHMNSRECMFITAFRSEFSKKENLSRNKSLEKELKDSGLGFVKCLGGFIENKDKDDETEVTESTYFVINTKFAPQDFVDFAVNLCKKYNQDDVLVTFPPDKKWTTKLVSRYYDKNGNIDMEFNGISLEKVEQYFTRINKKTFKFESLDESMMDTLTEMLNNHEFRDVNSLNGRRVAEKEYREKYGSSNALYSTYKV